MSKGLLLLTGVLWGCTNPFIRQGTRGLRKVKADTKLGQACAEITFLLGNWRRSTPRDQRGILFAASKSALEDAASGSDGRLWHAQRRRHAEYVVPWLVNQVGSLVYLLAVQRVPLSLAVPAANSLTFAFTALTGAAVGAEQPLDSGSILGIVLIGVGTALCCWEKAD